MAKPPVVLVVQNELDAPIGYLEEWLFERGVAIEVIYPFKGDAVPTEPGDFAGVIVLGGSRGVHDEEQWPWLKQEKELLNYATQELSKIDGLKIIGEAKHKTCVISFIVEGVHPFDLGTIVDKMGVAVRTGHHCTQPLMDFFQIPGTTRASFSFYNTMKEVDVLVKALERALGMLR